MQMTDPEDVAAQNGATEAAPAEGQDDAAMMQLLAQAEERHGLLDGAEPRGDEGEVDADDEAFDDDETPEEQADEASTEGVGEDEAAADVQGLDEALKAALRRDGLPDGLIDQMVKADRDGALAYALQRKENQREVSLAYQERAELKKQAEAQTGNGEEAAEAAQPDAANLDKLAQLLSDELSEETAGAVVQAIQGAFAPLQAKLQALEGAQAASQQERVGRLVSEARQTLRERFPKVADDDEWRTVYRLASHLESSPKLAHLDEETRAKKALEWAAREEYGDPDVESARTTRKRASKGVTRPSRRTSAPPPTADEAMWATFQRVERENGWQ